MATSVKDDPTREHRLTLAPPARPEVRGKFLWTGSEKLLVRGVTYGTFRPDATGEEYTPAAVERDFAQMAANGLNAVRTYTVPPRWLLDVAAANGLRVMVGLPWEQHVTFLDEAARRRSIVDGVRAGVRSIAGHPALLAYAVGNEIPAPIVRWHGRGRTESFLERLYDAAKDEDPGGLVTYVNFPSTEYLDVGFVDFQCFNVYLEAQRTLERYLARLHNIAGDKPLVMAEIGLDSSRNGLDEQARTLRWQVETALGSGCAGAFVFAWTDEWHRGGHDIEDWDFGLTDRRRRPKPALAAVSEAFATAPADANSLPRISVVVCTYNGATTLRDCLEGVSCLDYPDYEAIVVDDGSSDDSAQIASDFDVRLIRTENRGLSAARNAGLAAASGEIVAYTDDDARPDPQWLRYLARSFATSSHVGIGGPNIAPAGDGRLADCVANSPGSPMHVLISDVEAEHIPGCNSAYRKHSLEAIGGFDPRFRAAGDDVDVCWRLRDAGGTLGFSPGAMVWHHRRGSLRTYWRQQRGYGRAEALLEEKWPHRYNALGHLRWAGRIYGAGLTHALRAGRGRVRHGVWGSGLFQSIYEPADGFLASLPLMPEWYLLLAVLAVATALGAVSGALFACAPLLVVGAAAPMVQAIKSARRASFTTPARRPERLALMAATAALHVAQPLARLWGRLAHGLTPWRWRRHGRTSLPRPIKVGVWSESWQASEQWLGEAERRLIDSGGCVRRGGEYDRWELEARSGLLASARVRMTIEEHGGGRQLARFRIWPRVPLHVAVLTALIAAAAAAAIVDAASVVGAIVALIAALVAVRLLRECSSAVQALRHAVAPEEADDAELEPLGSAHPFPQLDSDATRLVAMTRHPR